MDIARDEHAITSIRAATRHRHTALEGVLQLVPVLTLGRYLAALRGFELFLWEWEPRINQALPLALRPWYASRSRLDLLQRDLAALDGERCTSAAVKRACGRAVAEIELTSIAATFGSLYVLEGSALGGRVIAAAASTTLGFDRHHGAAYFNGLDQHAAERWASFRRLLEEQVGTDSPARRQADTAACQTFDALIVTFSGLCLEQAAS
jgi:heme oxygenase